MSKPPEIDVTRRTASIPHVGLACGSSLKNSMVLIFPGFGTDLVRFLQIRMFPGNIMDISYVSLAISSVSLGAWSFAVCFLDLGNWKQ